MFVKSKGKQTLEDNFQEAIKVEKDLGSISSHLGNEEHKYSTSEQNGKKSKGISKSKSEDSMNMEIMRQMIKKLTNEVINLMKRNSEGKKHSNPFLNRKTSTNTSSQIPPTLSINLED